MQACEHERSRRFGKLAICNDCGKVRAMSKEHVVQCGQCQTPAAKIINGELVIASRHHGEHHQNRLSRADIAKLFDQYDKSCDTISSVSSA